MHLAVVLKWCKVDGGGGGGDDGSGSGSGGGRRGSRLGQTGE